MTCMGSALSDKRGKRVNKGVGGRVIKLALKLNMKFQKKV